MYDGKATEDGSAAGAGAGDAQALAPVSWAGLAARFLSARHFRASARKDASIRAGSFDQASARRIAAHGKGKQAVNHDASANSKDNGCTIDAQQAAAPQRAEEVND